MSGQEEERAAVARIEHAAEVMAAVSLLRRAEMLSRRHLETLESADRLRQRADALVAAFRRGDAEPLSCESPPTPPELVREAFHFGLEYYEAQFDRERAERAAQMAGR